MNQTHFYKNFTSLEPFNIYSDHNNSFPVLFFSTFIEKTTRRDYIFFSNLNILLNI